MSPSTGRIVHINDSVGSCQAAIISDVSSQVQSIQVAVFRREGGTHHIEAIPGPEERAQGQRHATWHWPERTE